MGRYLTTMLLLLSISTYAESSRGMITKTNDEVAHKMVISNISSISYNGELMVISHKDGNEYTFNINEVESITFNSVETAIRSIYQNKGEEPFSIFDINGKEILSGITDAEGKINYKLDLRGVYVVKTGDSSKKVIILKSDK